MTLTRTSGSAPEDRGTKRLIVVSAAAALLLAVLAARRVPSLELPGTGWGWFVLGLALVWAGFGLRIWAIATLGRFFRRVVVVQDEHVVVRTGPYRLIRHPAYAGNLLLYAGLGFALGNLLSLAVLIVLPVAGHAAADPRGRGRAHAGARRALSSVRRGDITPRARSLVRLERGAGPPRREDRCVTNVPRSAGVHGPP